MKPLTGAMGKAAPFGGRFFVEKPQLTRFFAFHPLFS